MNIWHKTINIDMLNKMSENTMLEILDIKFTESGEDWLKAQMPVDHRTHQPYGILHGGASVSLAETLGSVASHLVLDPEKKMAVGLEINANHIKSVRSGLVFGLVSPIHLGKSTHLWDIKIVNEMKQLVCISRLTVAILEKRN